MNGLVVVLVGLTVAVILMPPRGVLRRLRGPVAHWWRLPVVDLAAAVRQPARLLGAALVAGGLIGLLLGGPVAGVVLAVYSVLGTRALVRRTVRRSTARARARSLDDLSALAADLRAGLPVVGAAAAGELLVRTRAVWALADQTGAPAADLVERIEADARAADRARASASAEAAGAQATALLLAALPAGGIGLGFGLGANPLQILLHTPLGAGCAIVAVLLQAAGLLWCERLAGGVVR